jgi:hypothetical protein
VVPPAHRRRLHQAPHLAADANGRWSTTYAAVDDHRYYAVFYGPLSNIGLTQINR